MIEQAGSKPRTVCFSVKQQRSDEVPHFFAVIARFETTDSIGPPYVATCITIALALQQSHSDAFLSHEMRSEIERELGVQAGLAQGGKGNRRDGDSLMLTGWLDDQMRAGRPRRYGYPPSELQRFPGTSMEMATSLRHYAHDKVRSRNKQ